MSFSTSTPRLFTALLAAGTALAKPIAKPQPATVNLGPGIPTASDLTITSLTYFGDGCPEGSLQGQFCPETSSFNVSMTDLKSILQDGQPSDDASCHIEVGFKSEAHVQLNLLHGDFYGSCYLESPGMTALAHSSVTFAGGTGGTNIPALFYGPIDAKGVVYEHDLLEAFISQCSAGGDFLMLIDLVLHVTRGPAAADAVGYVDIDQLTGAISHAFVLIPSPCGTTIDVKPPSSTQQQYGGSYGKEAAEETKKRGKTSKTSSTYTTKIASGEEENKKEEERKEREEREREEREEEERKEREEREKEERKKEEAKKKCGGSCKYTKKEIEYKKNGGKCGPKCAYTPCSPEEEDNKTTGFSKYEKKLYYEAKYYYKLSLKIDYTKEQKTPTNDDNNNDDGSFKRTRLFAPGPESEEDKKKKCSGGGGGCNYNKEEIEYKKNGGECGPKCAYTPCSLEEEDNKVTGFSEYETKLYFEAKYHYELSLEIEYTKEQKTPTNDNNDNNDGSLGRTRLFATEPESEEDKKKKKKKEEEDKKKEKCKRDGNCGH